MERRTKYTIVELKLENKRIKPKRDISEIYTKVRKSSSIDKIALILFSKCFINSKAPIIKGKITFTNGNNVYTRKVSRVLLRIQNAFKNDSQTFNVVLSIE